MIITTIDVITFTAVLVAAGVGAWIARTAYVRSCATDARVLKLEEQIQTLMREREPK